jgi:hypothetical protein
MRPRAVALLALTTLSCATGGSPALFPPDVTYLTREQWGAKPPALPMPLHHPVRLTIHHTGVRQNPQQTLTQKLRGLQDFSQRDDSLSDGRRKPAWGDVPYHYYLSVDGSVGEARDWRYAGDSNTPYDPAGHLLLVVEGNFEHDTLTTAQRRALDHVVSALAHRFRIPADSLASHRDYAGTSCPGSNLYAELPRLRRLLANRR